MEIVRQRLGATPEQIAAFCRRWQIAELALFGSVVRDDFRPDSDIDVMVDFAPGVHIDLWDFVQIKDEMQELFGREVDMVQRGAVRNPFRRHSINRDLTVLYAA
jgi:predicted nucleotidyltransferase